MKAAVAGSLHLQMKAAIAVQERPTTIVQSARLDPSLCDGENCVQLTIVDAASFTLIKFCRFKRKVTILSSVAYFLSALFL